MGVRGVGKVAIPNLQSPPPGTDWHATTYGGGEVSTRASKGIGGTGLRAAVCTQQRAGTDCGSGGSRRWYTQVSGGAAAGGGDSKGVWKHAKTVRQKRGREERRGIAASGLIVDCCRGTHGAHAQQSCVRLFRVLYDPKSPDPSLQTHALLPFHLPHICLSPSSVSVLGGGYGHGRKSVETITTMAQCTRHGRDGRDEAE